MCRIQIGDIVDNSHYPRNYKVRLDGLQIEWEISRDTHRSNYSLWFGPDEELPEGFHLNVYDNLLSDSIAQVEICDIDPQIVSLYTSGNISHVTYELSFSIILLEQDKFTKATIALDGEKWKYLWSIEEFIAEISTTEIYSKINCSHVEHPFPDYPTDRTVDVYFVIDDDNSTLAKERVKAQTEIKKLIELTEISLQAKLDENSLVSYFNFPVGLQGACEGYLLSFVEFLKEVGVDATAELKEDKTHPGQVLFSVTPGKGKDALGKVKQALDCYIEAATTTNFEFNPDASISALKFEAQVRHFQSQFALSQAQIRALEIENRGLDALARLQEATILSHQTTIENITANNVFLLAQVDSWRKGTAEKAKDEMRFLRGIVTLKEQRIGPFTLNAARFLYEMQQLMQDDGVPGNLREDVGLPALPPHDETKNY